jgi:hypothetical protein
MPGKSKPGKIHLRIIEVMKRFPDGISGGQIRHELENEGLEPGDQTHLDRRKRDLKKWFVIKKDIATIVTSGKKRKVTLYKYAGVRREVVDEGQISLRERAEVIHSAHGRCQMCGKSVGTRVTGPSGRSFCFASSLSRSVLISASAKAWQSEYSFVRRSGNVFTRLGKMRSSSGNELRKERTLARFSMSRASRSAWSGQTASQYLHVEQEAAHRVPPWDKNASQPDSPPASTMDESSLRFSPLHLLHATRTFPGTCSPARYRFMPSRCSITATVADRSQEQ